MKKREAVEAFRKRLTQIVESAETSRSAFARSAHLERSTLSQLLSPDNARLPRVETLLNIAVSQQVSVDWLLGLSQEGHLGADIMPQALEIAPTSLAPVDERLLAWHREAEGYKIRYVPTTLPDLLKTEDIIAYEFHDRQEATPDQRRVMRDIALDYQRRPETDMEVCQPLQDIESFARGEGNWRGLSREARRTQLAHMADLVDELYPTFRWFLYDGRAMFSAPLTVFGPLRAVLYIGQSFFVFNSTEHIRELTRHFDSLIRAARIQPPDVSHFLQRLLAELDAERRPAMASA